MAFDYRYPTPLPSTKGWGPGYPDCQESKIVPHPVFQGGVHEDIKELVDLIVAELIRKGYRFHDGWSWGFGCRGTKSSSGSTGGTPSFHSWGLGLDFNAPENVFGSAPNSSDLATDNRWVVGFMERFGFFWLGPSIGDWMHFSFVGSPADAKAMTEKARNELGADVTGDEILQGITAWIQGGPEPASGPARKAYLALEMASKVDTHKHQEYSRDGHGHGVHSHTVETKNGPKPTSEVSVS